MGKVYYTKNNLHYPKNRSSVQKPRNVHKNRTGSKMLRIIEWLQLHFYI